MYKSLMCAIALTFMKPKRNGIQWKSVSFWRKLEIPARGRLAGRNIIQ
jgi:hypothetical protein